MMKIDVAVCTFRRADMLADCLRSVARQRLAPGVSLRMIVADNNPTPLMRDDVAALAVELATHQGREPAGQAVEPAGGASMGMDSTSPDSGEAASRSMGSGPADIPATVEIAYVLAPAANISIARNACLDAARGDWLVFIDDDELAEPDWLARLLARAGTADQGPDVIFGVSEPMMPPSAPGWSRSGEFHANRLAGNDQPHNGYTCNVALRRAALGPLRFAVALGTTGGEDTLFFHQANARGLVFAYAPDAVVREHIPPSRAGLAWVLRRRFRSGQIHHSLFASQAQGTRVAALASAKAAWCFVVAAACLWSMRRAVRHLARGTFHCGVVLAALGRRPVEEYAPARSVAPT